MTRFDLSLAGSSLEGRVLVYAVFLINGEQSVKKKWGGEEVILKNYSVIATYCSMDADDIVRKSGIEENVEEIAEQMREMARERKLLSGEEKTGTFLYKLFTTCESEKDINEHEHDVLYVGAFHGFDECVEAIDKGEDLYLLSLKEQMVEEKKVKEKKQTHEQFKGECIKQYLTQTYIIPLLKAKMTGDTNAFKKLEGRLLAFSAGASFESDVHEVCTRMQEEYPKDVWKQVGWYIEKIDAVHREDYERAAEARDALKRMNEKK